MLQYVCVFKEGETHNSFSAAFTNSSSRSGHSSLRNLQNNWRPCFQTQLLSSTQNAKKDHNSSFGLLNHSRVHTLKALHHHNVSEWALFSVVSLVRWSTKSKRFDLIDLLSCPLAAVRVSLSQASAGDTGNLCSLICVIVRGVAHSESSIIHSGHIQQVIVCCCIPSTSEKCFIHLHVWQEHP